MENEINMRKCPICDKSDILDESQSCPNPDCLWEFEVWLGATEQDKEKYRKRVEVARRNYQAAQVFAKGAGAEAGAAGENAVFQKQDRGHKFEKQSEYSNGNELSSKCLIKNGQRKKTTNQYRPKISDPEEPIQSQHTNIQTSAKSTKNEDNGGVYEGNFIASRSGNARLVKKTAVTGKKRGTAGHSKVRLKKNRKLYRDHFIATGGNMSPVLMIVVVVATIVFISTNILAGFFDSVIFSFIISINLIAVLIFWWDKSQAIESRFRIPNTVLNLIALCGGSLGSIVGVYLFRHKTLKSYFKITLFFFLSVQILIVYLLL